MSALAWVRLAGRMEVEYGVVAAVVAVVAVVVVAAALVVTAAKPNSPLHGVSNVCHD